jgi:hypothetical protein
VVGEFVVAEYQRKQAPRNPAAAAPAATMLPAQQQRRPPSPRAGTHAPPCACAPRQAMFSALHTAMQAATSAEVGSPVALSTSAFAALSCENA